MQRASFSITVLILEALRRRRLTKTKLMQELLLNYTRAGIYTIRMRHLDLIDYNDADRTFGITSKGLQYLEMSEQLAGMIKPLNSAIEKYKVFLEPIDRFV
jgi:predicted transcriptional regulator